MGNCQQCKKYCESCGKHSTDKCCKKEKVVSLQLDRGFDGGNQSWQNCDYKDLIRAGSQCIMENQKDVFEHLPLQEIRAKSRIKKSMEEHLRCVQSNEGGSKSKKQLKTRDGGGGYVPDKISNAADGPSALDDLNWQDQFEKYTQSSTPERLLDHCQQMQEDLTLMRYFIEKLYKAVVEHPGSKRQEQFDYNYIMKCKQSQKIESNIKKLHEKEDFAAASDSMSSKESGATHPTTPTTADSKNITDQLLNLQRALEINENNKEQAKLLSDHHKKFVRFETTRFNQIMNEIDQIIDNCDKQMENTLHLLAGDETNANKTDRQSSASSYYNYGVYGKFPDNSNDTAGQMQNVYEEGTYTTNNASVSVDGFALRLQGKKIHQSDSKRSKYKFIDNDPNIHVKFKEGTVIAGRYEILGPIDHGKFGHVFQCRDKKRKNKIVAAKISGDQSFDIDNAKVETKLLERLAIVPKNDSTGYDSLLFMEDTLVFENRVVIIFECLSLNIYFYQKMMMERGEEQAYNELQIQQIMKQICEGLVYMKNKGVIHCDIKPENILFTDENADQIKVIDFGASCENYQTGFSYVQSRMYRAPEVVLGSPYSHPIDMWSLGCVLFEMVNGSPLFPAQDENELLEFYTITLGHIPQDIISQGSNNTQFFVKSNRNRATYELIRSDNSSLGKKQLIPRSQTIEQILSHKADKSLIEFINRCLVYSPEKRMTPQEALNHRFITRALV